MIVKIEARFSCDECGTEFIVGIDSAREVPDGWTPFDVAEDEIRACRCGNYQDGHEPDGLPIIGGYVDGDRHLCQRCARKRV